MSALYQQTLLKVELGSQLFVHAGRRTAEALHLNCVLCLFVCLSLEGTVISCVSAVQNLHFTHRMNVRVSCDCHNSSCTTLTCFAAAYARILTD